MDFTTCAVIAIIVVYVILEYLRRERQHRRELASLRKGEKPPEAVTTIAMWKIFTTGGVFLILLGVTGYMAYLALGTHIKYASPLIVMTGICVVLAVMVGLMFFRNMADYGSMHRSRREES